MYFYFKSRLSETPGMQYEDNMMTTLLTNQGLFFYCWSVVFMNKVYLYVYRNYLWLLNYKTMFLNKVLLVYIFIQERSV